MAKDRKGKIAKSVEQILRDEKREPVPTSPIDVFMGERERPREDQGVSKKVLDLNEPSVIDYVARLVILSRMNYLAAARELFPKERDSTVHQWSIRIKDHPKIQKEVEQQLDAQGLGDKAKQNFVLLMHEWLEGEDAKLRIEAARILSRGYIGDKIIHDKPEVLPIEGLDKGLEEMGLRKPVPPPDESESDEDIPSNGSQLLQ